MGWNLFHFGKSYVMGWPLVLLWCRFRIRFVFSFLLVYITLMAGLYS